MKKKLLHFNQTTKKIHFNQTAKKIAKLQFGTDADIYMDKKGRWDLYNRFLHKIHIKKLLK